MEVVSINDMKMLPISYLKSNINSNFLSNITEADLANYILRIKTNAIGIYVINIQLIIY